MATTTKKKVALTFAMEPQLGHAMCWAAVGASCALFYDPTSGWTQCKLASASITPSPGDCCANPENSPCDITWYLQNKEDIGSFVTAKIAHNFHKGFIPFSQLMNELDQGRVVAYLLEMDIDGEIANMTKFSHFMVIAGYESTDTEQNVIIYDSYFGKSEMAYKEFVTNYKCQGDSVDGHKITRSLVEYTFFSIPAKKS
ncbi:C39 family peptidase [Spirosoma areae]